MDIIITSDVGWDDITAISLLMKKKDINILGVVVTGYGETHQDVACYIARSLLQMGNMGSVPVVIGAARAYDLDNQFPPCFRADMDTVCGELPKIAVPARQQSPLPVVDFFRETLTSATDKVTILSLGGFSNTRELLPDSARVPLDKIAGIVEMGGAVRAKGNVAALNGAQPRFNQGPYYSTNKTAEWNIFVDAKAAAEVFASQIPVTMVPLDAVNSVLLKKKYLDAVTATDPVASLIKTVLTKKFDPNSPFYEGIPLPIFDPVAAMFMAGQLPSSTVERLHIGVNTTMSETDNHFGQTFETDDTAYNQLDVVTRVDESEFYGAYCELINAPLR